MSAPLHGVYGVSGCGRGVLPLARSLVADLGLSADRLVFVDDAPAAPMVNGHHVLTYQQFLAAEATDRSIALAIANSAVREKLDEKLRADGINRWSITAGNVVVMDDVAVGEGAILCPFVTLTSNIRIGRQFHANIYSFVEHDCVIGDFVTFAPAVKCNGNVWIEDHAYIGAGAIIRQGKPGSPVVIGRGAVVGMGAIVTRSVPPGATVIGNPARQMRKD